MIRANLLPRRRETLSLLAFEIESDLVREMALALTIVAVVAALGIGIERYRIDRLEIAATGLETQVAANTAQRETSRRLMLAVARYQEFGRQARLYRRSGAVAAIAIARLGNSLPPSVWVDDITRVDDGYSLSGGSRSIVSIAGAVAALARDNPNAKASLTSIDNSSQSAASVKFVARVIAEPISIATPAAPRGALVK